MSGDYNSVLDYYLSSIKEDNRPSFPLILNSIRELISQDVSINIEQLNLIKPLIDDFDEQVQELAIELYSKVLQQFPEFFSSEVEFCVEKLSNFEPSIRDLFIDNLIQMLPSQPDKTPLIIKALLERLNDDSWKIRLKIVDFFNNLIKSNIVMIRPYKTDFLKILDEKDLDVSREGMELLLGLIEKTFTPEDVNLLVFSIPGRDWLAQEKILWLIGKLGGKSKELIEDIVPSLVNLLDFEEYLVQQKATDVIAEIMEYYPDLFDKTFFTYIEQEQIENINEIERLLTGSIHKFGYIRFLHLFNTLSPDSPHVFHTFTNSFKNLTLIDPKFGESLLLNLIDEFLDQFTQSYFDKIVHFLKHVSQYSLYLTCYTDLINSKPLPDSESENRRQDLIDFLLKKMPELGYEQMGEWISQRIKDEPIALNELCQKYSMSRDQLIKILENLINKGLLDAVFTNDNVQKPELEDRGEQRTDIAFLKRWLVQQDSDTNVPIINFEVKISNCTDQPLTQINLFLIFPRGVFLLSKNEMKGSKTIQNLAPAEEAVMSWTFLKKSDLFTQVSATIMKLVITYQKGGKVSSMTKKIDVLVLY